MALLSLTDPYSLESLLLSLSLLYQISLYSSKLPRRNITNLKFLSLSLISHISVLHSLGQEYSEWLKTKEQLEIEMIDSTSRIKFLLFLLSYSQISLYYLSIS